MRFWNRSRRVRVVVFGSHSADWMRALGPTAAVWSGMAEEVAEVVHVRRPGKRVPLPRIWGRRTVLLPLMEDHVASRPQRYATLAPTPAALATLRDKGAFAAYACTHGLGHLTPPVYPTLDAAIFPCVLKRTDLNGGQGVEVADSRPHAEQLLSAEPFVGHSCIFQAFVSVSAEYVAHCVCRDGRLLWHRVYAYERADRAVIRRPHPVWHTHPASVSGSLLQSLESFLAPLEYSGPCNIDFAIDDGGRAVVFEINPRLGGSLMRPENLADLRDCLTCIVRNAN